LSLLLKCIILDCCQVLVAHACNPTYVGGWDQDDQDFRPSWANSSGTLSPKITRAKWTEGVAQVAKHLLCKCEALNLSLSSAKKKKCNYRLVVTFSLQIKLWFNSLLFILAIKKSVGGFSSMVQPMLKICKALDSIPSHKISLDILIAAFLIFFLTVYLRWILMCSTFMCLTWMMLGFMLFPRSQDLISFDNSEKLIANVFCKYCYSSIFSSLSFWNLN
jgi:hypothetical protein